MSQELEVAFYYRGGDSLKVRSQDVKIDPDTGKTPATDNKRGLRVHGVSVYNNKDKARRLGTPYRVVSLPEGLKIEQRGRDPEHHEIIPDNPMTLVEYEGLLTQVVLELDE